MNIVAIQETDWVENLPLQTHHIFELLSKRGHHVTVIDFPAKWTSKKGGSVLSSARTTTIPNAKRMYQDASIRLVRPGFVRAPAVDRLSAQLTQFTSIFRALREAQIVVLYSVPTNGWQTVISSKILRKPIVFHSFDVLHEMTNHSIYRLMTWPMEGWVYRNASHVMTISTALGEYVQRLGVPSSKITFIPPGIDIHRFHPGISGDSIRKKFRFEPHDKVILYSGWLYEFCGVDLVLKEMRRILDREPDARLLVCGDGPLLEPLRNMSSQMNLNQVVKIAGRQPFNLMPEIVASSTICINPYQPDVRSHYAFPSKVLEYLGAGKPVVMTRFPGCEQVLPPESGVTFAFPEQIGDILSDSLADAKSLVVKGAKARKFAEEHFSFERIVSQVEDILAEVLAEQPAGG